MSMHSHIRTKGVGKDLWVGHACTIAVWGSRFQAFRCQGRMERPWRFIPFLSLPPFDWAQGGKSDVEVWCGHHGLTLPYRPAGSEQQLIIDSGILFSPAANHLSLGCPEVGHVARAGQN